MFLKTKILAKNIRLKVLDMMHYSKSAHLASCFSCIDILAVIYENILKISPSYSSNGNRHRFILSKGHAAAAYYAVMYFKKILTKKEIDSFCKVNSLLEEHPSIKLKSVEAATGSLGHGLNIACGIALGAKIKKKKFKTFVLMSDGECNEGTVWEAAIFASSKKLNNLYAIIDSNKWQATERTKIIAPGSLFDQFKAFGWNVKIINGHNYKEIYSSFFNKIINTKPTLIIANTIKGKGVSFMEDDNNWHYKYPNQLELFKAKQEIMK